MDAHTDDILMVDAAVIDDCVVAAHPRWLILGSARMLESTLMKF